MTVHKWCKTSLVPTNRSSFKNERFISALFLVVLQLFLTAGTISIQSTQILYSDYNFCMWVCCIFTVNWHHLIFHLTIRSLLSYVKILQDNVILFELIHISEADAAIYVHTKTIKFQYWATIFPIHDIHINSNSNCPWFFYLPSSLSTYIRILPLIVFLEIADHFLGSNRIKPEVTKNKQSMCKVSLRSKLAKRNLLTRYTFKVFIWFEFSQIRSKSHENWDRRRWVVKSGVSRWNWETWQVCQAILPSLLNYKVRHVPCTVM